MADPSMVSEQPEPDGVSAGLWLRSLAWLAFLGPFFFVTYGLANSWTSRQPHVGSIVFDWEQAVFPFVPMLTLPYMSIDLFYGLSLLLVRSRQELDTHAKRLLLATIVSVACFFLYPLQFKYARPQVDGFNGFLLGILTGFDKPFNQAPSLHISLLILLWVHYAKRCRGMVMACIHVWFFLIGVSVLLTWQHHFIDVIGGMVVGFGVWYGVPDAAVRFQYSRHAVHPAKAALYGIGAIAFGAPAAGVGGLCWLLCWPAVSCAVVAAGYCGFGASVFQKTATGGRALAATVLLLPYLFAAHLSRMYFTLGVHRTLIGKVGGLTLLAWPGPAAGNAVVLDLCGEFRRKRSFTRYRSVPMLDLVFPTAPEMAVAMAALEDLVGTGPVLCPVHLHCALGRGRSAVVAAAWLLRSGQAATPALAVSQVMAACPLAHISDASKLALENWWHGQ
ncbi:MAG: serine/threonine protein phosphatase [Herminiimonas sp.]|nr:serine/threonine protein phosphatase [Herminiimonas sp.]